jgi:flagellar P-ring protein precursor FlgI
VGRVPNGGIAQIDRNISLASLSEINLILRDPDYTSISNIAQVINNSFNEKIARSMDASTVKITIPEIYKREFETSQFLAIIETLKVDVDIPARVVINERTGTVVVGEHVTISSVAISHGNLNIEIQSTPIISQPPPLSQGKTVVVPEMTISAETPAPQMVVIENATTVADVAQALNELGVSPRDLVAIFQALKQSGALNAELIIM